eukprot:TRINITY_DN90891_c0_g1_i1.p1 TRINITY_DN90891_c0_g1~~TRINITY_DN90891_c0_g1_i1.p1  ORF type:complete len:511 (+),score=90.70 TRINITY_DN90891_c0_g1_i1:93-1535(+)
MAPDSVEIVDRLYQPNDRCASNSDFRCLYQSLASPTMGFFGEPPATPRDSRLHRVVELAEQAPEMYTKCDSPSMRRHIKTQFESLGPASELLEALEGLPRCELACLYSALIYVRHMFHQGDPGQPPVQSEEVILNGRVLQEPAVLSALCEQLSVKLGVQPYLNLTTWIFFNWTTTGTDNYQYLSEHPEMLKMRFQWFQGAAGRTEQNFWRAFAISEMQAVPMYEAVSFLLEALDVGDEGIMAKSLCTVSLVVQRQTAAFKNHVREECIDVAFFNQMQNTAHFGMASAGAGGFQLPWIILLDALLGKGNLPAKTQQVREENHLELHVSVRSLVEIVKGRAPVLRTAIIASTNPELKEAFNGVVSAFTKWRATHRARAANWLENSTVTTGRDNQDMEGDVKRTFQKEMDHIIAATKARAICLPSATREPCQLPLSCANLSHEFHSDVSDAHPAVACPFVSVLNAKKIPSILSPEIRAAMSGA